MKHREHDAERGRLAARARRRRAIEVGDGDEERERDRELEAERPLVRAERLQPAWIASVLRPRPRA